ncbi:MAG: electron transfer flavoprotein subunit alpha/FixB family protein [Proteobacteria bacterium]|nr:electron transfer flavoprotein subunit alpha/FixB family protein [Pseudomonadota bacterium]MBU1741263.1 electron transfer flavoprotein subunit alpha/FixB family protein [Pseudomonadota bacterium]
MSRSVVVIVEPKEGETQPIVGEMIGLAERIGRERGSAVRALTIGARAADTAGTIADQTGVRVTALHDPSLATYSAEAWLDLLGDVLPEWRPALVCLAHDSTGLDLAPALAVDLGAACVTGVEGVAIAPGGLEFIRPIAGGKFMARLRPRVDTAVITIMPGVFEPAPPTDSAPGLVEVRAVAARCLRTRSLGVKSSGLSTAGLDQADVIVAAGRGVGRPENLALIERLAALFPRSAVAASRPVVDAGWLEYRRQVGQTGATVAPKLYIACGVSGARQHTMGMQGSGFIVAISIDPDAAIFNLADVVVVEDLTRFIPVFVELCQENQY